MITPKHVIFSSRAFTSVLAETKEKLSTETGGIFLGIMDGDIWYVVEAIDPGPKSIFQASYFEYDGDYVRHLSNKINRMYCDRLDVLGLWHRHPGSMDTFSYTDDETIEKFAEQNNGITISALVNIDPVFRMTMYCCTPLEPVKYKKISIEIDDSKIPVDVRTTTEYKEIESQINTIAPNIGRRSTSSVGVTPVFQKIIVKKMAVNFRAALVRYLKKNDQAPVIPLMNGPVLKNDIEDRDYLIDNYIADECLYCDEIGLPYSCECSDNNDIILTIGKGKALFVFRFFCYTTDRGDRRMCFGYNGSRLYHYEGNLIKGILGGKEG